MVAIEGAKMGQKTEPKEEPAEQVIKQIRRINASAVFGGGEDPHRPVRARRRGQLIHQRRLHRHPGAPQCHDQHG